MSKEAFDKWANSRELQYPIAKQFAWHVWEARQSEIDALNKEIARLRGELSRPKELNGGKFELVGFRCKDKGASEEYWAYLPMRFYKVEQAPDTDVDLLYVNTEQV